MENKIMLILFVALIGCSAGPELGVYARQEDGRWKYVRQAEEGCLTKKYDVARNGYYEDGIWHEITSDTIVVSRYRNTGWW